MKQHITPSQAEEITEEQFYSLFDEIVYRKDWADYHHKKVTIGKMIEILRKYDLDMVDNNYREREWSVDLNKIHSDDRLFRNNELCDALWEAVKSTL